MALTYRDFLSEDKDHAGVLYFGGARMALLDIEAGFWGLRRQVEALVGRRLTDAVLQQAGANGGASFARAFAPDVSPDTAAQALRDCIASYQAAGFGQFEIEVLEWPFGCKRSGAQDRPIGRVLIRGTDTFEAWMMRQHGQKVDSPACAYTAGVLVGFVNVLAGRHDVVCIEHTCQAQGDQACLFELLPADAAGGVPVVALAPDPALGRQLNLLEMLFDRMPMGIAIFDRDYCLRRYNPTWASFADRYASPSASPVAPGVDYFEILPGAEPIVLPLFERVLAGETVRQEAVRLEVEGIVSYWDVVLAPLVEDGTVTGILNVCTDATNRVQAQEALKESESKFRLLFEESADAMLLLDGGVFVDCNQAAVEMMRCSSKDQLLSLNPHDISPEKQPGGRLSSEKATDLIATAFEEGSLRFEWVHRTADGTDLPVEVLLTAILLHGRPVLHVVWRDITERVLAQQKLEQTLEALREWEAHLHSLLENATDFAVYRVAVDPANPYQGEVVLVSPSIRDITGISDPHRFESWFENIHPDDLPRMVEANRRAWEEGERYDQPVRVYHPQKEQWVWVRTMSTPVFDAEGRLTHFNGLVVDITEQKRAEEALQAQVAFEDLITTISTNFINITLDEIDGAINRALQTIGEFAGVDRSCVFLFSADKAEMDCTHEWCTTGIAPQIQRMQGVPISSLAWFNAKIMRGETLHIPRVADLPPEASAEQAEFQQQGAQSLVVVPMAYRGTVVGFLGFGSVRTEKTWSEESIKLLKIVGEIFINALEHKRAQAIQAGQRQFLELLARGGTLSETLHALVRIIEEQWPGMLGLILLLDEERQHLHHGASISLPEEYVQSIEGLQIGPMVGSCGTASYWGERVIVEDITTDPRWDGLRDLAIKYRLGACWSEPVFSADGRVIATFAMYYRHPRAPTEAELRTIEIAAHLVGVAIEHRRAQEALQLAYQTLEQRVEERTREIERRRQVAEGLSDILARLNSNLALDEILDFIVDQANRLLDTSVVALYLLEGKDDLLTIQASRGLSLEYVESIKVAIGEGTIGRVVKERRPMVIPDVRKIAISVDEDDPSRSDSDVVVHSEQLDLLAKLASEFVAVLAVPLIAKDEIYGGLALYYPTPREFTDEEINLATAFADHAALAIENARLRIQEEQAAVMQERNRLARELHDSVSQALYGIGLGARTARTLLDRQPVDEETKARLANPLDYVLSLADAGLAEMRALIFELRLDALEKEGLVVALSKHAEALHARHKLDVHTEFCEEPELPLETKEALYRIAQEALNNVVKHAHASQVEIRLAVSPAERIEDREGAIALEVRDDGIGFDPQDEYPGHLGLQSMQERATRLGGTLEIESAPGRGALLRVRIPFGCASLGYARDRPFGHAQDRQGRPPA